MRNPAAPSLRNPLSSGNTVRTGHGPPLGDSQSPLSHAQSTSRCCSIRLTAFSIARIVASTVSVLTPTPR